VARDPQSPVPYGNAAVRAPKVHHLVHEPPETVTISFQTLTRVPGVSATFASEAFFSKEPEPPVAKVA
jgi:hypothetical protein